MSVFPTSSMGSEITDTNFASTHTPFGNLANMTDITQKRTMRPAVPLTINSLSVEERRDLVWRSKKLHKVLGEPLAEISAERVLVTHQLGRADSNRSNRPLSYNPSRPSLTPNGTHSFNRERRSSFPPQSPSLTPINSFSSNQNYFPLSSPPMGRSTSTPGKNRFDEPPSPDHELSPGQHQLPDPHPNIPNASAFSALGGTKQQQKEERRKKLAKLQRLLGERVPVGLVNEMPGKPVGKGESVGMGRSNSGLGKLLKEAGEKLGIKTGGTRKEDGVNDPKEEEILIIDLAGSRMARGSVSNSAGNSGDVGVKGMSKARKLEQVCPFELSRSIA